MLKYVITWCLISYILDPCPELKKTDEFGRRTTFIDCDVLHGHLDYDCEHEKQFYNKDSAITFYNRIVKEEHNTIKVGIHNLSFYIYGIEIDSTWTLPY